LETNAQQAIPTISFRTMSVLLPAVEAVFSAILPSLLPELYDPHEHQDHHRDYYRTKETEQKPADQECDY